MMHFYIYFKNLLKYNELVNLLKFNTNYRKGECFMLRIDQLESKTMTEGIPAF